MKFLRDRSAARDATAFEDCNLQAGPRQVAGTGEAVVARTDDGYVVLLIARGGSGCSHNVRTKMAAVAQCSRGARPLPDCGAASFEATCTA